MKRYILFVTKTIVLLLFWKGSVVLLVHGRMGMSYCWHTQLTVGSVLQHDSGFSYYPQETLINPADANANIRNLLSVIQNESKVSCSSLIHVFYVDIPVWRYLFSILPLSADPSRAISCRLFTFLTGSLFLVNIQTSVWIILPEIIGVFVCWSAR